MYVPNLIVTQRFPMMNRNRLLMEHFQGAFPLMLSKSRRFAADAQRHDQNPSSPAWAKAK
ncbi:hypothetical protein [Pantoea agglomerans]|uniref:hypothetical protein n=1 Tax=Enterobacter agglomerans TaxID=549 RepID=UPI003D9FD915